MAHCDEFKPAVLRHSHVIRHYEQIKNGLGKLSPEAKTFFWRAFLEISLMKTLSTEAIRLIKGPANDQNIDFYSKKLE